MSTTISTPAPFLTGEPQRDKCLLSRLPNATHFSLTLLRLQQQPSSRGHPQGLSGSRVLSGVTPFHTLINWRSEKQRSISTHLCVKPCRAQEAGLSHKARFLPKYPRSGTASEPKKGKGSDEIPSTGTLTSEETNF